MYGVVIRHLSGIQKGIQYQHATQEYANQFSADKDHIKWAKEDKTTVILECNSTDNDSILTADKAEMQDFVAKLIALSWKYATFVEPDLNNTMTAVVCLADDRIWDKTNYPDWKTVCYENRFSGENALEAESNGYYKAWLQKIGGPRIAEMKKILGAFRLASN